jgi:hypothetical protein
VNKSSIGWVVKKNLPVMANFDLGLRFLLRILSLSLLLHLAASL